MNKIISSIIAGVLALSITTPVMAEETTGPVWSQLGWTMEDGSFISHIDTYSRVIGFSVEWFDGTFWVHLQIADWVPLDPDGDDWEFIGFRWIEWIDANEWFSTYDAIFSYWDTRIDQLTTSLMLEYLMEQ